MKAVIIGCGFVSQFHVKAWQELGAEVVAVCDIYEVAAKKLASSLGVKAYTNYEFMLKKEDYDVVSIATPPFNHAEIIRAALAKGSKVVVEKPFTLSSDEAAEFKDSRNVTVVHNQVFQSFFYQALKALKIGIIGKVYEVRVTTMASSEDPMTKNPEHWSHKLKGGRIAECLPHPIYIAQFFCRNDALQVERTFLLKRGNSSANKIDELTAVLAASGVRAVLNVRLNALRSVASVDVYGERGMLKAAIIPRAASVYFYEKTLRNRWRRKFFLSFKIKHSPRYLIFKSLMKGKPLVSASHGFHNIRILEDLI